MKETPPVRRAKSNLESSKKPNKVSKKSLITDFSEASGEFSPISDPLLITESSKAVIDSFDPVDTSFTFSVSESDLTPSSTITTCGSKEGEVDQTISSGPSKIVSVESELVVNELRAAMVQVLKSRDVDSRSKKVLDAVVNAVIEDLPGVGISDVDWFNKLAFKKAAVVLLNLLGVITAIQLFISGHQQPPLGPTPT